MSHTAPGLGRFQRSMVSKHDAKCFFCGTTTVAFTDYAALDNGKWIGACALHASSVVEQCKALIVRIQTTTDQAVIDSCTALTRDLPLLDVLQGTADDHTVLNTVQTLALCVTLVDGTKPAPVRANKYAGRCATCKGNVAEGAGRIARNDAGKWITYCYPVCVTHEVAPVEATVVPEGRYALTDVDGTVKFYRVQHGAKGGKWEGFVFVSAQASDELHPIRNRSSRTAILDAIAADLQGAVALYGKSLGVCGRCGRTLTDEESRRTGVGPVCANKAW